MTRRYYTGRLNRMYVMRHLVEISKIWFVPTAQGVLVRGDPDQVEAFEAWLYNFLVLGIL